MHVLTCPKCGRMQPTPRAVRKKAALCPQCGAKFIGPSSKYVPGMSGEVAPAGDDGNILQVAPPEHQPELEDETSQPPDNDAQEGVRELICAIEGSKRPVYRPKKKSSLSRALLALFLAGALAAVSFGVYKHHNTVYYEEYVGGVLVFSGRISKEEWLARQNKLKDAAQEQGSEQAESSYLPMEGDISLGFWQDVQTPDGKGFITLTIKNIKKVPLYELLVELRLLDEFGNPTRHLPAMPLKLIPAGGEVEFSVNYDDSLEPFSNISVQGRYLSGPEGMICWQALPNKPRRLDDRILVTGTGANEAGVALRDVRVHCEFFSEYDQLLGSAEGQLSSTVVPQGEDIVWSVEWVPPPDAPEPTRVSARIAGVRN